MCALTVAQNYKIALAREGNCYRGECPVCGRAHLTFAPSNRYAGYYFSSPCYNQAGRNTGSGANLDYWLRSLGATGGEAMPGYLPTEAKPTKPLDVGMMAKVVHGALMRFTPASAQGQYWRKRGLTQATGAAWKVGAGFWCNDKNQSLVFPWFSPDHTLVGISHRLIAPTEEQPKAPWHPGMAGRTNGLLCGWHTHQERSTLIIVEGVPNAPSLYQECGDFADILTPGSENVNPDSWDLGRLRQWEQVAVWADKLATATAWGRALGTTLWICSESNSNGAKVDANDWLLRGELREFVQSSLGIASSPLAQTRPRPGTAPTAPGPAYVPRAGDVLTKFGRKIYVRELVADRVWFDVTDAGQPVEEAWLPVASFAAQVEQMAPRIERTRG